MKPKIFVTGYPLGGKPIDMNPADPTAGIEYWDGDVIGEAIAEDGAGLAQHLSSSWGWLKHDMGIDSDWKHDAYNEYYPEGWEIVLILPQDAKAHTGLQEAIRLNKETKGHGRKAVPA